MQIGRYELLTDKPEVNYENIIQILQEVFPMHQVNAMRINYLLGYEAGNQPLQRAKTYRSDIDCKCVDNVAHEIAKFHIGYKWGVPITVIQRGEKDSGNDKEVSAISLLNEQYEMQQIRKKTQKLARFVEICGVGYTFVDINSDYEDGESLFNIEALDARTTFVVRSSYYYDRRVMISGTYRTDSKGNNYFTCFTNNERFEILNLTKIMNGKKVVEEEKWQHVERSGEINPLGINPIIEWIRNDDRMGCFERQISDLDNLNLLISDFTNDVEQNTQAIWHGNDIEFPVERITNEDGTITERVKKPGTNEWVITSTPQDGKTPFIKPLAVEYDYQGMLNNIVTRRALILQKCNVPQRNDNSGGSTGIAMDSATGWSAAEAQAQKQQNIMESCKMEEIKVVLSAIKNNPYLPSDSPLLGLKYSDIQPNIKRSKTYELTVKTNALTTLLSHGFDLRDAAQAIPMFEDNTQVIERSGEGVKKYQDSQVFKSEKQTEEKRPFADASDQISNSPNIN